MTQMRFTEEDFNTFTIDGLDARMEVLKERVRPKLTALGEHFAPTLSALTGDEMFPHVAKHARRSVNPPADSWVAFANSKRGYKKLPHFQIGLWESHVFVWFAIIYESPIKEEYGKLLEANQDSVTNHIPDSFVWSADHTKPGVHKQSEMDKEQLKTMFERLQTIKKAELLCGIQLQKEEVLNMNNQEFLQRIDDAFQQLAFLYRLTQKVSQA
ncbi:YktB family protein [Bacillus halotolerans]|uniref:YktB family protein n=1 Tax=Bacillus halotolerans TaxID=260554 RepID=UPI00227FA9C4|nr:YktB family protein [Bacillus halotolerans]MCY8980742.1 YktB family protein [Bacillus halotolerans]MEC1665442.1 YktB family protein [Bacillus halotolerans]